MASECKSYSLKFKFDALKREFNVGRQQIRYWNKQRAMIINAKGNRFLDSRKIRRVRKRIAKYPLFDTEMVNMIKKRRMENKSVTQKMVPERGLEESFPSFTPTKNPS